jgi:hypothetical protein
MTGWLLGIVGLVALDSMGGTVGLTAQAQEPAPPVQELAERLLAMPYPLPLGQQDAPSVELLPGQAPDDLPFALALPPGARLVGSMVRQGGPLSGATIVLDAPGTADALLAFYEQELEGQGWHAASVGPFPTSGGFQVNRPGIGPTYCLDTRGPSLSIAVNPSPTGPSDVRLTTSAGPSLCSATAPPVGVPLPPLAATLLPRLTPPPGVVLQPGSSSGGGSNRWSSEATAETTRNPSELEAYFADQLAAAGWTRQDGSAAGHLAWSAWTVPGDGDWRGLLLVAEWPEASRRLLAVRVESPSTSPDGDGGIVTMGGGTYSASQPPVAPPPPLTAPPPPQPGPGGVFAPAPTLVPPPPSTALPIPAPDLPPPPRGGFVPTPLPLPARP